MGMTAKKKEKAFKGTNKSLPARIKEHWVLYLFILPCFIWLLVFCYYPMYGAVLAFKDYRYDLGILGSPWVGFKHFKAFMTSQDFWLVLKNTLVISIMKLIICFPAPIILALLLNEVQKAKFKKAVQTMSYLPNFVSWVVVVSLMTVLLSPYGGIVNNIRQSFGLEPIFFLGTREYFYPTVILSDIWKNVGWGSIVYLAALTGIDPTLYEAATIDGASRIKCTWHITMPGMKSIIGIMFIFAVGGILNAGFDQILLLQQPDNMVISEILDTYVLKRGLQYGKFEYATAVGLFKSVFALIMMISANTIAKHAAEVSVW